MVARDGMAAGVAWRPDGMVAGDGMAAAVAWRPDGTVARDGGQMAWWPDMVAGDGSQMARWRFYLAQKNAGPVHIFRHASIVIVRSSRSKFYNRMDISYANIL